MSLFCKFAELASDFANLPYRLRTGTLFPAFILKITYVMELFDCGLIKCITN